MTVHVIDDPEQVAALAHPLRVAILAGEGLGDGDSVAAGGAFRQVMRYDP